MTDVTDRVSAALADRYGIERRLGAGGMATVYLADDRKHNRQVAIKVLKPEIAAVMGAERFLREIETTAGLQHPHILPLFDSGKAGAFLYYVMPFIDGESLRDKIEREIRLSLDEALRISAQVADALSYAHRQGVLHRDIKPENILLSQGHAIVADFGIAKAVTTAGGAQLTRAGFAMGTPGYMSPEQAAGLSDLDARADVYSLAAVCYEMLVGEVAPRWPSDDAVREGRFLKAPNRHRAVLDTLPRPVERTLVRSMAVRIEDRPESAAAFMAGLQSPASSSPSRRYRDTEVDRILARAAELDHTAPTNAGLTLGSVQDAAAQAGIPAKHVRQAAEDLAVPGDADARFLGSPTVIRISRIVDGEVPESEFEAVAEEIRLSLGVEGYLRILIRSMTWRARPPKDTRDWTMEGWVNDMLRGSLESDPPDTRVRVVRRGGRTYIDIEQPVGDLAWSLFGGIIGGVGGGGAAGATALAVTAVLAPVLAVGVGVVSLAGSYGLSRAIYRAVIGRRTRRLAELADRLVDYVRDVVPGAG